MRLKILDRIDEGDAYCLLCKTSLHDYVLALPDDFKDFIIQRGIVTNKYLDRLWETIETKQHIPSIVLTTNEAIKAKQTGQYLELKESFKILDGLQRSNRLNIIIQTINFIVDKNIIAQNLESSPIKLSRKYSKQLKEIDSNSKLFSNILSANRAGIDAISLLKENYIWLELWVNLNDNLQIKKMLILNAGHKSVNIKHQIELLFLNYYDQFNSYLKDYKIYREKENPTIRYSKLRKQKELHFSHLISSLESLNSNKPISTNSDYSAELTFLPDEEVSLLDLDSDLFDAFGRAIRALDGKFADEVGVKWLGREVVLVGIFGAIGRFSTKMGFSKNEGLNFFVDRVDEFGDLTNLGAFEDERNNLELSKVNIGNVNKKAIFNFTFDFLEERVRDDFTWREYFRQSELRT